MDIDDERNERPKFGLARVVLVLALAWLVVTVFGIVMDVAHRAFVVAIVVVLVLVLVKVSRISK